VVHQRGRVDLRFVLLFEIHQIHNTQIDFTARNRATAHARMPSHYRDICGLGPGLLPNGAPKGHVDVTRCRFDWEYGRRLLFAHVRESPFGTPDGLADAIGQEHTSSVHVGDDIELLLVVRRRSRRIQGFQHLLSQLTRTGLWVNSSRTEDSFRLWTYRCEIRDQIRRSDRSHVMIEKCSAFVSLKSHYLLESTI